jgi:hypothetical protein
MTEREKDWTEAERRALGGLAREERPDPAVEERVLDALRRRGLVRGRRAARRWLPLGAVAAGFLLLAAGYAAGRSTAKRPEAPSGTRFALLLLRGEERVPSRPDEESDRVAEYRAWARGLARGGRYVEGEKLGDRAERLASSSSRNVSPDSEEVRGFFIISAGSFEDALAVARGCPHLRHGGAILVRPIAL